MQVLDNAVVAPGEAALIKLRARDPFAAILAYDAGARTSALDAALAGLNRAGAYVVRIGNPLRTPLTMERILIQLAGFQTDLAQGEDTDTLMRTVITRLHTGRDRLVLSVEQAETLHPMALILLDQIARPLQPGGPAPQILLTGTPAFAGILGHPLLDRMRSVLGMGTPDPAPPPPPAVGGNPVPQPPRQERWAELEPALKAAPPAQAEGKSFLAVAAPDPATRLSKTIDVSQPALPRSRWPLWLLCFVVIVALVAGALYAAVATHLLPPKIEATAVSVFGPAAAWLSAAVADLRTRLLSVAGML